MEKDIFIKFTVQVYRRLTRVYMVTKYKIELTITIIRFKMAYIKQVFLTFRWNSQTNKQITILFMDLKYGYSSKV